MMCVTHQNISVYKFVFIKSMYRLNMISFYNLQNIHSGLQCLTQVENIQ